MTLPNIKSKPWVMCPSSYTKTLTWDYMHISTNIVLISLIMLGLLALHKLDGLRSNQALMHKH
jgi:glycopeptide antibiotics resistance protein